MSKNKIIIVIIVVILIIAMCLVIKGVNPKKITTNSDSDYTDNEKTAIEHYKQQLKDIPKELTIEDAVARNYFVYDGVENKIYNEDILKKFVANTEKNAINRIEDEIIIVIYNIEGKPLIYNLGYAFNDTMGYVLAKDYTRLDISTIEHIGNEDYYDIPNEYLEIVVDTNFPKECYGIEIIDTGFSSNAITLKSYSDDYKDVEIARYMIKN